jgi:hypothetical protein
MSFSAFSTKLAAFKMYAMAYIVCDADRRDQSRYTIYIGVALSTGLTRKKEKKA